MPGDLDELTSEIRAFAQARDWHRYHAPKNLVMALSVEVAELMENFQWLTNEESDALDPVARSGVIDEMADVQVYLLELADRLGVDMVAAVRQKMVKNAVKYPAP
jgi:dCTP diphosphatase